MGLLLAVVLVVAAPAVSAVLPLGAPQATELWGGPAAKGLGASGSRFDTNVTISTALAPAAGSVEYWAAGEVKATVPFSIGARDVVVVPTPAALDGAGAFLYHVTSSAAVSAWSDTYNDTPSGRFGVGVPAFTTAEFLGAGDEASGGGAEDSTDAARSRTNVGVLCSPASAASCQLEVSAFSAGTLLGVGTITAAPGAAAQSSLSAAVPAASGRSEMLVVLRMLNGLGEPYVIRNDNRTSDGTVIPLSVTRAAFSTAPTVSSFTATPDAGCAPLAVTLTWATTGAARVTVSGVSGDLPPSGTTTVSLLTSTDLVLTAFAATGATTSVPRHVSVSPPQMPPTPSPASMQVAVGGTVNGLIPTFPAGTVTAAFVSQESTGSTITLTGSNWVYVAGSVPGTDVVRFTAQTLCGPLTADFTATVLTPGAPQILSFTADPPIGCSPQNVVFSWTTLDAVSAQITNVQGLLSPNGSISYPTPLTATTAAGQDYTFQLTARNALGQSSKTSLSIHIDSAPPAPALAPTSAIVYPGQSVTVTPSNLVSTIGRLGIVVVQNETRGTFRSNATTFVYTAGGIPGTDIFRVVDHNGCGYNYATFTAQVIPAP